MLIKFSVLWVEDDDSWYQASHRVLKRHLNELGFHLDVTRITDPENTVWDHHFETTSQYDLMLVDWRIEDTNKVDKPVGGDVISRIRAQVPYSDILFYSGSGGLEKEVYDKRLQGVYTAQRRSVRDDAKELIDHLLHKTLHPKIMRGIIVSSLSQIDDMCFKIIESKFNDAKCDQEAFANELRDSVSKQAASQLKDKEKILRKSDGDFIASLHSTMILDSYKRANKLVGLAKDDLNDDAHKKLSDLPDTICKRNWLAHWKRVEETDTQIILVNGEKSYTFDQPEAARMRKKINEAGEILSQYLAKVSTGRSK